MQQRDLIVLVVALGVFIVLAVAYRRFLDPTRRAVGNGTLFGYLLGALGVVLCFQIAFDNAAETNIIVLVTLLGGVVGWITGILITPQSNRQMFTFNEYGKAISAFFTGFVLAKFGDAIQALGNFSAWTPTFELGLVLFVTMFCLGTLFTFIARLRAIEEIAAIASKCGPVGY